MIDPITGVMAGVSAAVKIAGAISSHAAEQRQADATEAAARQALRLKRRDLSIRSVEETQRANQGRRMAELQAETATATTKASAASAGVQGNSVDALLGEVSGDLASTYDSIDMNLVATLDQIDRMREGVEAEGQRRIASVGRPSMLQTVLRTGGAALGALGDYRRMTNVPGADVPDTQRDLTQLPTVNRLLPLIDLGNGRARG